MLWQQCWQLEMGRAGYHQQYRVSAGAASKAHSHFSYFTALSKGFTMVPPPCWFLGSTPSIGSGICSLGK